MGHRRASGRANVTAFWLTPRARGRDPARPRRLARGRRTLNALVRPASDPVVFPPHSALYCLLGRRRLLPRRLRRRQRGGAPTPSRSLAASRRRARLYGASSPPPRQGRTTRCTVRPRRVGRSLFAGRWRRSLSGDLTAASAIRLPTPPGPRARRRCSCGAALSTPRRGRPLAEWRARLPTFPSARERRPEHRRKAWRWVARWTNRGHVAGPPARRVPPGAS